MAGPNALEREYAERLHAGRNLGVLQRLPQTADRGPANEDVESSVLDEEGFDQQNTQNLEAEEEAANENIEGQNAAEREQARQEQNNATIAALQSAGAAEAANEDEEADEDENAVDDDGLDPIEAAARGQIDISAAKIACKLPVGGHFIWWNIKLVYGTWFRKGKGKFVGPFTFNDVLSIPSPTPLPKAQIIPDKMAQNALIIADMILLFLVLFVSFMIAVPLIMYAYAINNPLQAASLFGQFIVEQLLTHPIETLTTGASALKTATLGQ